MISDRGDRGLFTRVADPHSFHPDPDPIRIQGFNDKKLKKKKLQLKNFFFASKTTISLSLHKERPSYRRSLQLSKEPIQHFKTWTEKKIYFFLGSKTAIYLSLGLHKERPSCRRSLQLSKEAIQHFKTWTFTIFFSTFVGHFCPPGSGSGFRIRIHWPDWIRIQSGSATLPRSKK